MTRIWIAAALLGAACAPAIAPGHYTFNDAQLGTLYRAKEVCSCLFVMEQTAGYCSAWTATSPDLVTFTVDDTSKTVEAEALIEWGAVAHFLDARAGCAIEDL